MTKTVGPLLKEYLKFIKSSQGFEHIMQKDLSRNKQFLASFEICKRDDAGRWHENHIVQCEVVEILVKIILFADGKCKAEFRVEPEHSNIYGFLHGGFSAALVDVVSGLALFTHDQRDSTGVSVNLNISYLKNAKIGDDVIIEARTTKAGKNLGFLQIEIKNKESGDLLVSGTHTKYIGKYFPLLHS